MRTNDHINTLDSIAAEEKTSARHYAPGGKAAARHLAREDAAREGAAALVAMPRGIADERPGLVIGFAGDACEFAETMIRRLVNCCVCATPGAEDPTDRREARDVVILGLAREREGDDDGPREGNPSDLYGALWVRDADENGEPVGDEYALIPGSFYVY